MTGRHRNNDDEADDRADDRADNRADHDDRDRESSWPRTKMFAAPHPAVLDPARLLRQCDLRTQRRSGPGGQHRNKTSSGVFLCHRPSGVTAEATERRSQADNRAVALRRLRFQLAIEVRSEAVTSGQSGAQTEAADLAAEQSIRDRYAGSDLRLADRNQDKPAVLALVLDDLYAAQGQPSRAAARWGTTTTAVVRLVKSHPPAFQWANDLRRHHGRGRLK